MLDLVDSLKGHNGPPPSLDPERVELFAHTVVAEVALRIKAKRALAEHARKYAAACSPQSDKPKAPADRDPAMAIQPSLR